MECKISIIVPVYNTSAYLKTCLDSLISQTLKEIQIICINDGSQDNSLSILREYENKDSRVIVFDIENQGVSNARNLGLQHAIGEYVTFVDSDDWIALEFCEKLYNTAKQENADAIMCGYYREYKNNSFLTKIFEEEHLSYVKEDIIKNIHRRLFGLLDEELSHPEKGDAIVSSCMQLLKGDLAKKIRFADVKEIGTFEDGLFQIDFYKNCNRFIYINLPLYHYRKTNEQSITTKYKPKLFEQWQRLYDRLYEQIQTNNYGGIYHQALSNRIAIGIIGLGLNEVANKEASLFQKSKRLKGIIRSDRYQKALKNLTTKNMPFKWKVFFGLAKKEYTILLVFLLQTINKLKRRKAK